MTKKHFIMLAKNLKWLKDNTHISKQEFSQAVDRFCMDLEKENKLFDWNRFRMACGLNDTGEL